MTGHDAHWSPLSPWLSLTKAWTNATEELTEQLLSVNQATLEALGAPATEAEAGKHPSSLPGILYRDGDWSFEGEITDPPALHVGDAVTFTKTITDTDVRAFGRSSGDTNRLHLDDDFARKTRFGDRIVHGTLIAGLISAALARLPLLTIYLSQNLDFLNPVEIGATVTARCEVIEDLGDSTYRLTTTVTTDDATEVIDGEAIVLIDDLPGDDSS